VAGDPGQFPKSGFGDPTGFLRQVGKGLAARDCNKIKPTTTTLRVSPGSSPPPATGTLPPTSGENRLSYGGTVTGSASLGSDGSKLTASLKWTEQATSPANDPSTVTWTLTFVSGKIDVTGSSTPGVDCSATLSKKAGAEKVFSPGISHLPGESTYDVNAESPADGTSTGGPPQFQVQSTSSDPNTYCGAPNSAFRVIENFPTVAENTKVAAALHPKFTAPSGTSTPSFNYTNPAGSTNTLSVVSDITFMGA